ncbi:hypothetical protein BKP56_11570 [Marinilactibacillus sp. 15R]|uniref:glycosyltransferase family 2 protein n=1 Tax=Marinilactibacillus psychrotolerans TaxID=191770 RepID=UPI00090C9A9D|nr:glycosyltransferase family 2 protein [Marinilactibacillus sp. 15R]API89860.1 hypothetical protein BKP56_11570 [Marinilactibacillus sp. 15R]
MISIVMPVYNVQKTLVRAVESVINQSYKDFELILVNDGSTDKSGEICDELAQKDNRVIVLHKENGGLSSARNYGLDNASRKYIMFIDSDDYYETDIISHFIKNKEAETDLFVFNVRRINNKTVRYLDSIEKTTKSQSAALKNLFEFKGADFYAWNKIYLRTLFDGVRYPEGYLYEDIVPSYEIVKKAKQIQFSEYIGYNYIENSESIVNAAFNPKQYDNVLQRVILLEKIEKEFPELLSSATEKLLDGFLSTGYKLSLSEKSETTVEYYKILKKDIRKFRSLIKNSKKIPKPKLIALKLLQSNLFLYGKLYKFYLGK